MKKLAGKTSTVNGENELRLGSRSRLRRPDAHRRFRKPANPLLEHAILTFGQLGRCTVLEVSASRTDPWPQTCATKASAALFTP